MLGVASRKTADMAAFILILTMSLFSPQRSFSQTTRQEAPHAFYVWNVGQGLWTTYVTADICFHFDMGGEYAPWEQITSVCQKRFNQVYLTHWDLDHIGFVARIARELTLVCLQSPPVGPANPKKQDLLAKMPMCRPENKPISSKVHVQNLMGELEDVLNYEHSSNELSQVFLIEGHAPIVVPGDSTVKKEKYWAKKLPPDGAWLLVLGHHGSRTSTSVELLERLSFTRMAIASSRHARYGHPHLDVINRLKIKGIALLKTEDWGTLRFEVPARLPKPRGRMKTRQSRIITERISTADKAYTRGSNSERRVHRSRGRHRRLSP